MNKDNYHEPALILIYEYINTQILSSNTINRIKIVKSHPTIVTSLPISFWHVG